MGAGLGLIIGIGLLQTDLRVETVHLRRFYNNFASVRSAVTPPLPVPGMDTEAVLVETYEAGKCPPLNESNKGPHIYADCIIAIACKHGASEECCAQVHSLLRNYKI
jgi:hypothetical protein